MTADYVQRCSGGATNQRSVKRETNEKIEPVWKVEMLGLNVFDTRDLVIPRYN